jgi:hypothetical protein
MTQPNEMTNAELNEVLAVEVMGLAKLHHEGVLRYVEGREKYTSIVWNPAEDLNQAIECAEKLWAGGYPCVELMTERRFIEGNNIEWRAYVDNGCCRWWESINQSPARALSEAVLMVKRGD